MATFIVAIIFLHNINMKVLGRLFILTVIISSCSEDNSRDGDRYFNGGDYLAALEAYNKHLEMRPNDLEVIFRRGKAQEQLGNEELAFADYNRVIQMDDRHLDALQALGGYYYRNEDYDNAHYYFEMAVNIDKDNVIIHLNKGNANQKRGKLREALIDYNLAISINKDYGEAYLSRGTVKLLLGGKSSACSDFKIAQSLGAYGAEKAIKGYCK